MTKILIIEDDLELARLMQIDLQKRGFEVTLAPDGITGLKTFADINPDLVVLDIALPRMNGLVVCERIRAISTVPLLIMTAHAVSEQDIAQGLDKGADEYILKPIRQIEFQARIKALLRRARITEDSLLARHRYDDGYLMVDLKTRQVIIQNEEVRLTPTEFKLLATFVRHRGKVMSFERLLETVWGAEYTNEHHYPRIYVSHLRRKIEPDPKKPTYIHNEYGVGYRFEGLQVSGDDDPYA